MLMEAGGFHCKDILQKVYLLSIDMVKKRGYINYEFKKAVISHKIFMFF